MEELEALKIENIRLRRLAQQDPMTGLFNRAAFEARVNERREAHASGVFLMMDVDKFKSINDKYGHLTGDRTLIELARIIELLFFKQDLIGRMGGDEFAVFLPGEYKASMVESKVNSLKDRFAQAGKGLGIDGHIRITVGAECAREGDTFQTLYERADLAMRAGKKDRTKILHFYQPAMKADKAAGKAAAAHSTASSDINYIRHLLREGSDTKGAYCQDFNSFLSIYRFLERWLKRTGSKAHLILLSLTDRSGTFVSLDEREVLMEQLRESLCTALRASDIYSQNSDCQLLALLPGATQENMDIITARIQNAFRARVPDRENLVLSFRFYPLQPVAAGKTPMELKGQASFP